MAEEIKEKVLQHMKEYAKKSKNPNAPVLEYMGERYTILQIIDEVEKNSDIGELLYLAWARIYEDETD